MIVNEGGRAKCICNVCKHSWFPRKQRGGTRYREPWKCPALDCQSYLWNLQMSETDLNMDLKIPQHISEDGDNMAQPNLERELAIELDKIKELENKQRLKEKDNMAGDSDYIKKSDIQHDKLMECVNCIKEDSKTVKEKILSIETELASLKDVKEDLASLKKIKDNIATKDDVNALKGSECPECHNPAIQPLSSYCPYCGYHVDGWNDDNGNPIKDWTPHWKQ